MQLSHLFTATKTWLADDNENHMLMLVNCWVLDHVRIFLEIKPFDDLSTFALKS